MRKVLTLILHREGLHEGSCNTCDPEYRYTVMNLFRISMGKFYFNTTQFIAHITINSCKKSFITVPYSYKNALFYIYFTLFNMYFPVCIYFYINKINVFQNFILHQKWMFLTANQSLISQYFIWQWKSYLRLSNVM